MSSIHWLLDTNTFSYLMNGRSPAVRNAYRNAQATGDVAMSCITAAEILYGIERRPQATRIAAAFEALSRTVHILPWDIPAARSYGRLRARMEAAGTSLEVEDMLIAAHALAIGAVLVTRDKDFAGVAGLVRIENWATDV